MIRKIGGLTVGLCCVLGLTAHADSETSALGPENPVKHVLLISVDGLHAVDLTNYVATHPDSTLAQLSKHGVTYANNSTSIPSDSFPGLPPW